MQPRLPLLHRSLWSSAIIPRANVGAIDGTRGVQNRQPFEAPALLRAAPHPGRVDQLQRVTLIMKWGIDAVPRRPGSLIHHHPRLTEQRIDQR